MCARCIRNVTVVSCCLLLAACFPQLPEAVHQPPPDSYRVEEFQIGDSDASTTVRSATVTSAFFPAVNARPWLGRLFTSEEHQARGSRVVLLSHRFWQEQLGGQPERMGTLLHVNGQPLTIIGVMPSPFNVPSGVDIWLPGADLTQ
jgi:hypothetical protein